MELNNVAAIITGGASGLGAATARKLAQAGARVALFDLNADAGAGIAEETGGLFAKVDVTDAAAVTAGLDAASAAHGPARILVCCAGIAPGMKTVGRGEPHDLEVFRKTIEINLIGSFNCIRLAAARMVDLEPLAGEERGVMIATASVAAFEGQVGQVAYAASKGGIVGATLPIARDLADKGIRMVSIAPGIFKTPMLEGLPEKVQESLGASVPFPSRLGEPDEYAALVQHICENMMINGTTIRLDGAIRMAPR